MPVRATGLDFLSVTIALIYHGASFPARCAGCDGARRGLGFLRESIQYWISRSYPPVCGAYFNVDWPSSCDYRLDGDAPAKQVWRDAVVNGLGAFD